MRSEQEMLDQILNIARQEEAVRVVILNGSRVNPNAPRDLFQDFDIIYFVKDVAAFAANVDWVKRFGDVMILQMPETMQDPPPRRDNNFAYLMQFTDGNRIDLTILPLTEVNRTRLDSLSLLLLDKDGIVKPLPEPTEESYLPRPPSRKAFSDCCNEFWWVSTYVAKALWRQEVFYAKKLLDQEMREQLMKMLDWHFGAETNFGVNPGKQGKYFQKYLELGLLKMLKETYTGIGIDENWEALFTMCNLFRKVALRLAANSDLVYPIEDDRKVAAHLEHVRLLPRDAKVIY